MKHRLLVLFCMSILGLAACKADTPSDSKISSDTPTEARSETSSKTRSDFLLDIPIDCTVGEDCWLMNYVDHDTQKGVAKDASCQARSYDGHKGTDIAILDWAEVLKGVDILAPAAGKVLGVRNNETDQFPSQADMARIRERGRECGNGVRIDHGGGWTTQLCHMKKGSVSVDFEQEIAVGTKLGEVGMSGITQHPHVHMTLRKDGEVIDPYTGRQSSENCGLKGAESLWRDELPYSGFGLYDAGFAARSPNFIAMARGKREVEPHKTAPALLFYMSYFGARVGDQIQLTITQPDGKAFNRRSVTQEKTRARAQYFTGKRNSKGEFMTGRWTATAVVTRPTTGERQELTREMFIKE